VKQLTETFAKTPQTHHMFRAVKEMPDLDAVLCEFCRRGLVTKRAEQIAFYQLTDKGYVYCCTTVPVSVCGECLAKTFDDTAEDLLKEAVEQAYGKLP
jgi:hypothetical protein